MDIEIEEDWIHIFPRTYYAIEFFNNPQISESHFTMRLSSYGEVSGCADMTDSTVEAKRVNDTIKLKVTDSEIELDDEKPRYSNYDCEIKRNRSFFDVQLNRDQLIKKKVKKIALTSEKYGEFMTAEVNINKHKIEISPDKKTMITFWFFPKNTVVLHTPNAKLDRNTQNDIRAFGIARGLVPIENIIDKFELPHNANHYVLFTDPVRHIVGQITSPGENITVGHITTKRTVHTADGPREDPYDLEVYATLPAQQK